MAERSVRSNSEGSVKDNYESRVPDYIYINSDSETSTDYEESEDCSSGAKKLECPVCLQACVHPTRLPCGHIFCFLCVKGIAQYKKCAMCRNPIPPDYLDNPDLVETPELSSPPEPDDTYQWYYEGRNGGWWQYEPRMSDEIEERCNEGASSFEMLICGTLYVINLEELAQYKKGCPRQRRRIRRDRAAYIVTKGVAGIPQSN